MLVILYGESMTLGEYALRRLHLDRQLRSSSRIIAYAVEALRIAETMALVLLVSDLTPWSFADTAPGQRLRFIAFFSLFSALFHFVRHPGLEASLDKLDRDAAT